MQFADVRYLTSEVPQAAKYRSLVTHVAPELEYIPSLICLTFFDQAILQTIQTYGEIKGHLKTTSIELRENPRQSPFVLRSLSPGKNLQQITVFGL